MSAVVHTLHVILAGAWLGGVVFTTAVVSPALKAMKWSEAERVLVRSTIGKRYARVGSINLALLLVFAVLDGLLRGFGPVFYVEYALLAVLFILVAAHGAYFGRRLVRLAEAERRSGSAEEARAFAEERHALQRLSSKVSWADILVSFAVAALAVNV
jgi:putative copper export protein